MKTCIFTCNCWSY